MDTTLSISDRVSSFKAVTKLDQSGAPMYQLAQLYTQRGRPKDLNGTEFWNKEATARDCRNASYGPAQDLRKHFAGFGVKKRCIAQRS